jgi:hypothetical protein
MTTAILCCHADRLEDVGPRSPSVQTVRMPWNGHLFDCRPQHKQRAPQLPGDRPTDRTHAPAWRFSKPTLGYADRQRQKMHV